MLIPHLQLCLAHYCDVHGPTPLMVTEGLPVPCRACYHAPDVAKCPTTESERPHTSTHPINEPSHATSASIAEAFRRVNLSGAARNPSVPAPEREAQLQRDAFLHAAAQKAHAAASAIETPPRSPQLGSHRQDSSEPTPLSPPRHHLHQSLIQAPPPSPARPHQPSHSRCDSGFRRTYDDSVTTRAGPCENCALTLPKERTGELGGGASGLTWLVQGPMLRTRVPAEHVVSAIDPESRSDDDASPSSSSSSSCATDTATIDSKTCLLSRPAAMASSSTSRSSSSTSSDSSVRLRTHIHYREYTSTHEPVGPSSFSSVRASCLRTLSFETLPRTTSSTSPYSPTSPGLVTTHSAGSAASGGPIFFGDPSGGYTTAYIFRIPDVHARGHKRIYAFLALSTHRERLAMKAFGYLASAFRDLALWIQALAEAEAERTGVATALDRSPVTPTGPTVAGHDGPLYAATPAQSSFLSAGGGLSRRMGSGYGRGISLKQRGLAELVGLPDIFVELHTHFVQLLVEVTQKLNQ